MEASGQLDHGYGVLLDGLLVVDVDARNGGVDSYMRLLEEIPTLAGAGLIVETGSGNGSKHLYFKAPKGVALVQHVKGYDGIDFKSSGFVVGPGSKHISGNCYSVLWGSVDDIGPAPDELIEFLRRPETHRARFDGQYVDVSDAQIADMLTYISPDCGHAEWIKIGMAIHDATGGSGFDLWDAWSSQSKTKYPGRHKLDYRWHTFGKHASPVSLGTLFYYAKQAGYETPVTFEAVEDASVDVKAVVKEYGKPTRPFDTSGVDLLRPPGFVGEVTKWLNTQGQSKRERLAVAAALTAIGNVAGLHYVEDLTGATLNLFTFCVAGSGSGKEAILNGFREIHLAAGITAAVHGNFKSEQELISNLIHHQAAFYAVDEVGTVLTKVDNARKRGGAPYLDGLIGQLMSIYSKADSAFLLTGDRKREVKEMLQKELGRLKKIIENNEDTNGFCAHQFVSTQNMLETIDQGIQKPFLSLIGFTVPNNFNGLVTPDFVMNGFMSRSLLFQEVDNNPKPRKLHKPPAMPEPIKNTIRAISNAGHMDHLNRRVEYTGERTPIQTTPDAQAMLEAVQNYFWYLGEYFAHTNGFEAVCRRGYELTTKVSAILAAPGGIRTPEHVVWAFRLIDRDLEEKARLAFENDETKSKKHRSLSSVLNKLDTDTGITFGVLRNRLRIESEKELSAMLSKLEDENLAYKKIVEHNGRSFERWFKAAE